MFSEQIDTIITQMENPSEYEHPVIYRSLVDSEHYKGQCLPSRASLLEEAIALVLAGTDTMGATLTVGTYRLLSNPSAYRRLKEELKEAWPDLITRPRSDALEKLPYLVNAPGHCFCAIMLTQVLKTAVIKESLRVAPTTTSETSRIVPAGGATIGGRYVPGNVSLALCRELACTFANKDEDCC